ncbi:DNA-directed RNA polymerase specialized sigma subunit, sigma24-like protein [Enhygromyxa salina]|uniref:RNA polymerase sigma factor n=2 Tax=Enhygromyxa salina TaxID=215803 RepID=A0A0C1ZKG9_9BACT|nr:DNA-directed RNA polymerase specialized sigma subunit, sigma24-like protein [Enhygromyxa salina]
MGVSEVAVDDVVQETFIVTLRRLDDYDPARASEATWLCSILRNVIRNDARSRRRRERRHQEFARASELSHEPLDVRTALGRKLLAEFLSQLDEPRRAVFVLAELEGMSAPEIAQVLGCKLNTVYSRLRVARIKFHDRFHVEADFSAATREQPAREVVARNWLAITSATGLELGAAAAPGAGGLMLGLGLKLAAATAAVGLAAVVLVERVSAKADDGAGLTGDARSEATLVGEPHHDDDPGARVIATAPPESELELSPQPELEPIPVTARQQAGVTRPQPRPELEQAIASLKQAQALALAGESSEALAVLASGRWPNAGLEGRARVLEVELLCDTGQRERAEARAQQWRELHPEGLATRQLDQGCLLVAAVD